MNDPARPANPTPVAEGDIYAACRAFVLAYALPALAPEHVFQGWQNRAALPEGTEEYACMSVVTSARHGTTVEHFSAPDPDPAAPGLLDVTALTRVGVMVEFCSAGDAARLRAQRFAVVARSSVGVQFFNDYGLSCLYADDVREHCFKGDANQFVRRYSTVLHLSLWSGDRVEVPYFDSASMARVENVDVHHIK